MGSGRPIRFLHGDKDQANGQECRNDGNPEHRLGMIGRERHQADGEEGADERAKGVERLAQTEARAAPRIPLPTRSMKRAAMRHLIEDANGKIGLVKAARP
jgi:hypothetical protein